MPTEGVSAPPHPCEPEEAHAQLERIVASAPFRNSKRLTKFLRFLVEKSLAGEEGELKERAVGSQVFGRPIDYDLTSDPVVRVAASDVRKRLAQYYVQEGHSTELRLELPPGSYHVQFIRPGSAEFRAAGALDTLPRIEEMDSTLSAEGKVQPGRFEEAGQTRSFSAGRHRISLLSGILFAILLCAVTWKFLQMRPSQQLADFWNPLWSGSSTLICTGDLNFIMKPGPASDADTLIHVMESRNHVGPNDLLALARIAEILGSHDKNFSVLLADNATLTDLRQQPDVLIGASDNRWTEMVLQNERFHVERDVQAQASRIVDATQPKQQKWEILMNQPFTAIRRDYALVSRITNSVTGQPQLVVAGLGPYGTAAASEFVTNPEYFRQFTDHAPEGWKDKSIQILLSTDVVDGRSGPPHVEIVDVH